MEIKVIDKYSALLKGKKESVLVNPSEEYLKKNKSKSRVVIYTSEDFDGVGFMDDKVLIRGAGEYEVGGVEIIGRDIDNGETIYSIHIDGVMVLVLGKISNKIKDKIVDKIEGIDVLLAPDSIGGEMSYKVVKEWAKEWGVNYLIPMSEDKEILTKFLDAADEEGLEGAESLKIDKENLPDGLELKLLKVV